jgi:hypothetical protein
LEVSAHSFTPGTLYPRGKRLHTHRIEGGSGFLSKVGTYVLNYTALHFGTSQSELTNQNENLESKNKN